MSLIACHANSGRWWERSREAKILEEAFLFLFLLLGIYETKQVRRVNGGDDDLGEAGVFDEAAFLRDFKFGVDEGFAGA